MTLEHPASSSSWSIWKISRKDFGFQGLIPDKESICCLRWTIENYSRIYAVKSVNQWLSCIRIWIGAELRALPPALIKCVQQAGPSIAEHKQRQYQIERDLLFVLEETLLFFLLNKFCFLRTLSYFNCLCTLGYSTFRNLNQVLMCYLCLTGSVIIHLILGRLK